MNISTSFKTLAVLCLAIRSCYGAFGYSRAVTIDHNKVPNTDQTSFGVLFSTGTAYSASLATIANGGRVTSSSGFDIGFYSNSDCATGKLNWETEDYSATTGLARYWVNISNLSHTADTLIYLCYGDATITTDQSNKTAVWDSNYAAVWHLPDGSSLSLIDSTSNGNTLTNSNATTATTGQIDGGASFAGASSQLLSRASTNLAFAAQTVSVWVKPTSLANAYTGILSAGPGAETNFTVYIKSNGTMAVYLDAGGGSGGNLNYDGTGATTLTTGNWYYVSVSYDSTNGMKSYVNGALDKSVAAAGTHNVATVTYALGVDQAFPSGRYLTGAEDEARVSNSARSADWVSTEYNNQNSPSTFYTVGAESGSAAVLSTTFPLMGI